MRTNRNSRGKISRRNYTKTIIKNNGIKTDANEKITKTIRMEANNNYRGRTFADMVYESLPSNSIYKK